MKKKIPNNKSSLSIWLDYINQISHKSIQLGLYRILAVAQNLKLFSEPFPFIFTVAGTNGKGTTCCMLEHLLINSNYKVGLYSSPHLLRYTERVRINGNELTEIEHIKNFDKVEQARGKILLTYFEFITLSTLLLFKKSKLDILILEVGLGGRLDATNIIDADIAIITNVALDHIDLLGKNLNMIGKEKAGIFKSGKTAIFGEKKIPDSVISYASIKKTNLFQLGKDWFFKTNKNCWSFTDIKGKIENLPFPKIPLINAATALAALRFSNIDISYDIIKKYIPFINLPGRFQIINKSPYIILDVAHNPHAASYLVSRLIKIKTYGKLHTVVGMLCDKDIVNTLNTLSPIVDYWYCGSISEKRGANSLYLSSIIKNNQNVKSFNSIEEAWFNAINNVKLVDILLVFGSFYTVAKVMKLISLN